MFIFILPLLINKIRKLTFSCINDFASPCTNWLHVQFEFSHKFRTYCGPYSYARCLNKSRINLLPTELLNNSFPASFKSLKLITPPLRTAAANKKKKQNQNKHLILSNLILLSIGKLLNIHIIWEVHSQTFGTSIIKSSIKFKYSDKPRT